MPGADLDEQQRRLVRGQRPGLAERAQVHVVLQQHRAAERAAQARGDGVGVPAGHDRRPHRDAVPAVDGTGHADHHRPRGGVARHLRPQRAQARLDGVEHRVRSLGDVDVDVPVGPHGLAQVDDGEVRAVCTEVGDQHVPAARGEREPVGRAPAARGGPRAGHPEHAAVEQLVDPVAHGRAGEPGRLHEVGLAGRGAGRDEARQRAERDGTVETGREGGRAEPQQREAATRSGISTDK